MTRGQSDRVSRGGFNNSPLCLDDLITISVAGFEKKFQIWKFFILLVFDRKKNGKVSRSLVTFSNEPWHEISNNLACATNKGSYQPAHIRSLIRTFASLLNML